MESARERTNIMSYVAELENKLIGAKQELDRARNDAMIMLATRVVGPIFIGFGVGFVLGMLTYAFLSR